MNLIFAYDKQKKKFVPIHLVVDCFLYGLDRELPPFLSLRSNIKTQFLYYLRYTKQPRAITARTRHIVYLSRQEMQ